MRSLLLKSAVVALGTLTLAGAASAQSYDGRSRGGWGQPSAGYGHPGSGHGHPGYRGGVAPRPVYVPPPVYAGGPHRPHVVLPPPGYGPRPGWHPSMGHPSPWHYRKWRRWQRFGHGW